MGTGTGWGTGGTAMKTRLRWLRPGRQADRGLGQAGDQPHAMQACLPCLHPQNMKEEASAHACRQQPPHFPLLRADTPTTPSPKLPALTCSHIIRVGRNLPLPAFLSCVGRLLPFLPGGRRISPAALHTHGHLLLVIMFLLSLTHRTDIRRHSQNFLSFSSPFLPFLPACTRFPNHSKEEEKGKNLGHFSLVLSQLRHCQAILI